MALVVLIASSGRKDLLTRTLRHLDDQTRPADEVIVSAPDESHVERYEPRNYKATYVFGAVGLPAQRNRALDAVSRKAEIVVFLDDDFVPADDYLENAARILSTNPDWAILTGWVMHDGVKGPGISFDEAIQLLSSVDRKPTPHLAPSDCLGAYGCNMVTRASDIGALRFDERLPLYGWLEDTDFSRRLARRRKIMRVCELRGVHLGVKSGRVSGVRFGYSQIANPVYLVKKGTMPVRSALFLMARNVAANVVGSIRPEPYIDRFGRLRGNIIATAHVLSGRIKPEYILKL